MEVINSTVYSIISTGELLLSLHRGVGVREECGASLTHLWEVLSTTPEVNNDVVELSVVRRLKGAG